MIAYDMNIIFEQTKVLYTCLQTYYINVYKKINMLIHLKDYYFKSFEALRSGTIILFDILKPLFKHIIRSLFQNYNESCKRVAMCA